MVLSMPVTGVFTTNAYFYIDDNTGHGFLIDPGAEADAIVAVIGERGFCNREFPIYIAPFHAI